MSPLQRPKLRILVVDDDEADRRVVERALRQAGPEIEMLAARSVDEAMEVLRREPLHCAFLDYRIAGGDGLEVIRRARAAAVTTPIVVITGQGDDELAAQLIKEGAADYLSKGAVESDRLLQSLQQAIRLSEAELRAQRSNEGQRLLAEIGMRLAASLDPRESLAEVAQRVVPFLGDFCSIDVMDETGQMRRLADATGDPAQEERLRVLREYPIGGDGGSARRALQVMREQGLEVFVLEEAELVRFAPDARFAQTIREMGVHTVMLAPLVARERELGLLVVGLAKPGRGFGADDRLLAGEVALRVALAVDNARLYERAQQAARAREEVLAIVSHDLRNPLGTILGAAELLLMLPQEARERELERQLEIIDRTALRMNRLIEDLLDVSRMEAGRLSLQCEAQEVTTLLADAAEMFQPQARERGIELETACGAGLPPVHADRERIGQVFSNLIGNALKFTPAGGRIRIEASQEGGGVRCTVRDTGPGILDEEMPNIFAPFWQASRSKGTGAGLGLSIARGIVEAHGGTIRAESVQGQGSAFHFTLPPHSTSPTATAGA